MYTVKVELCLWLRNIAVSFKITYNNLNLNTGYPTRFMLLNSKPSLFKAQPLHKHKNRNVNNKNIILNLNSCIQKRYPPYLSFPA